MRYEELSQKPYASVTTAEKKFLAKAGKLHNTIVRSREKLEKLEEEKIENLRRNDAIDSERAEYLSEIEKATLQLAELEKAGEERIEEPAAA